MGLYIDEAGLKVNAGLRKQHEFVVNMRKAHHTNERVIITNSGLVANDARLPADVWRDFDTQTKAVMSDEENVILNDLMPLARNVHIGKLVSEYRRMGDAELEVRTSIDGQHAKPVNRTDYDYDGVLVPVHSTQIGRNWRELEGFRSEGYDPLREDQEIAVKYVTLRTQDNFVNGTDDLTFKGFKAFGIKNSPNTIAFDLGAGGLGIDLTSPTLTYVQIYNAFVAMLNAIQGPGNNAKGNVTFYVSGEIWFNLLRLRDGERNETQTILSALMLIPGIAAIKRVSNFTGNEMAGVILNSEYIRPVVGMAVTSTPIARRTPMDDFNILVWGASGLQIKGDTAGRSGVLYASAA